MKGEDKDGRGLDENAVINESQAKTIERLIVDCEKHGALSTRVKFLAWLKIDSVEEIPANRFLEVRDMLSRKVKDEKKKTEGI